MEDMEFSYLECTMHNANSQKRGRRFRALPRSARGHVGQGFSPADTTVWSRLLRPCGDQHGERVAIEPRADPDAHIGETSVSQHPRELVVLEAEHAVAEAI